MLWGWRGRWSAWSRCTRSRNGPSPARPGSRRGSAGLGLACANGIAVGPVGPSLLLAARAGEGVRDWSELDPHEAGSLDDGPPPCARQGTGDSAGPEVDVSKGGLRDRLFHADVGYLDAATRTEHSGDLPIGAELVGDQIDHPVRDDDVRPPVRYGQGLGEPLPELDVRSRGF